jgi:hypothetical protein
LAWNQVPDNLLRLREGEQVVAQVWRPVYRVGYRLRADDLLDEAQRVLADPDVAAATSTLNKALRKAGNDDLRALIGPIVHERGLRMAVARGLVQARRFGGPDRGILVLPGEAPRDAAITQFLGENAYTVSGTRCVQVGVRFPSSGSGEDYEDGGLHRRKTVVLLRLKEVCGEFISGDFQRLSPDKNQEKA